jgi:hypothetical protein
MGLILLHDVVGEDSKGIQRERSFPSIFWDIDL